MAPDPKELETDFSPYMKVYKDGTVERLLVSPFVPPSLDDPITNVSSKDITISSNVSARLYLPKISDSTTKKIPIFIYYHGGGFCWGSPFAFFEHRYLNQLVSKANAVTISVEYRLAPENPLHTVYEDCWAALQWVASHVVEDSNSENKEPWLVKYGDFDKLYLGGDSAGGNIAHNMAMRAGAERLIGGVKILGVLLSFPFFCDSKTKKGSNEESVAYKMWTMACSSAPCGINNPLINPFAEDAPSLSNIGCEKVFVCCGEKDELREIDLRYVEALKNSGWKGEVELVDVEGEDHIFQAFEPKTEKAQCLMSKFGSFIQGKSCSA